jgi:ABC-2 type transport system ATP-binding protein
MKQKVALASALVHAPALLMLDEPLTGLDAAAARLVKDMLQAFISAGGTVLLTTHILEVAERLAQRIGIIHRGRLLAEGTLDDLRAQSGKPGATLEDVFLHLVGSTEGLGNA